MNTLVIQPLPGIGDMLWHLRLLRAIARDSKEGQITLLTKQRACAQLLLSHERFLKNNIVLDPQRHFGAGGAFRLAQDLKPYGFEKVWVMHHSPRYHLASWLADIPTRYGYGFGFSRLLVNAGQTLRPSDRPLHVIERFENFASLNDLDLKHEDHFLTQNPGLERVLTKKFSDRRRPWIVVGFGASAVDRQWVPEKFSELLVQLNQKNAGALFLCGTASEHAAGHVIQSQAQARGAKVELITDLSLNEVIVFLSLADLFIGNDSGLLNIAGAVGTKAIGLFMNLGAQVYSPAIFKRALNARRSSEKNQLNEITPSQVIDLVVKKGYL